MKCYVLVIIRYCVCNFVISIKALYYPKGDRSIFHLCPGPRLYFSHIRLEPGESNHWERAMRKKTPEPANHIVEITATNRKSLPSWKKDKVMNLLEITGLLRGVSNATKAGLGRAVQCLQAQSCTQQLKGLSMSTPFSAPGFLQFEKWWCISPLSDALHFWSRWFYRAHREPTQPDLQTVGPSLCLPLNEACRYL